VRIFFSHESASKPLIRDVREALPQHIDSWIDEHELVLGEDLTESIRHAITVDSDFLVVFLNGRAVRSSWVQTELRWALEEEDRIGRPFVLPVLLEDDLGADVAWARERKHLKCHGYNESDVRYLASELSSALFAWLSRDLDLLRKEQPEPQGSFLYTLDDPTKPSFPEMTKGATGLDVLSRTAVNLINSYRSELLRLVRNGAHVRVVMVHPSSDVCKYLYGRHLELFQSNLRSAVQHLNEFEQLLGSPLHDEASSLQVKFVSDFPPFSLTHVRRGGPSASIIKVQLNFLYTLTGRDRPIFDLCEDTEWYAQFRAEFEAIWRNTEYCPLDELAQTVSGV
jgi:hypothetical protein